MNPISFALGCGAPFVARTIDTAQKHMPEVFKRAQGFKGASFVEILQNCIVYNDAAWASITEKATAADKQLLLEHGKPMIFGKNSDKGIAFDMASFTLKVVDAADANVLVHDEKNAVLARLLGELGKNEGEPVAMGVLYAAEAAQTYERAVIAQVNAQRGKRTLEQIMRAGEIWEVA